MAERTNIFLFAVVPYATPSVISCDTCNVTRDNDTVRPSDCHLNRKFACRNDRNDASEAWTKAHRTETRCSTYREKFDGAAYWKFTVFFFFSSQIVSFAPSELCLSRRTWLLLCPSGVIAVVPAVRRDVVQLCECIYKRCTQIIFARTLFPEIARVFSTTSIPAGAINSVIGSRSRTDFRNNIRTFSGYCVSAECILTENNRYRKEDA